jgi:hypothetical protein
METSIYSPKNIPFIIWIIGVTILLGTIIYFLIKAGKKRTTHDDLIYLEFLIKNSTGNAIDKKNIGAILDDYKSRKEYQGDKLNYLDQEFNVKYPDPERLRDKLVSIENKRLEKESENEFSPENTF